MVLEYSSTLELRVGGKCWHMRAAMFEIAAHWHLRAAMFALEDAQILLLI